MTTVVPTDQKNFLDRRIITWTPLTTTNADGTPTAFEGALPGTIQVTGTFGAGGTLVMQGSNDGTNWFTMRQSGGSQGAGSATLSFTAAGLSQVLENPVYMRPLVTAGDGTTSLTVILTTPKNQFSG